MINRILRRGHARAAAAAAAGAGGGGDLRSPWPVAGGAQSIISSGKHLPALPAPAPPARREGPGPAAGCGRPRLAVRRGGGCAGADVVERALHPFELLVAALCDVGVVQGGWARTVPFADAGTPNPLVQGLGLLINPTPQS
eukprot:gene206-biopygen4